MPEITTKSNMKTFKNIREFNISVGSYLGKDPKNIQTKLGYAIKKLSEVQIKNAVNEYQKLYSTVWGEDVENKYIDNALVDKETGAILNSPKGSERPFLFDKEGLKKVMSAEKIFKDKWEKESEKFDLKEFEITPHYVKDLPKDLTDEEKEAFKGFVIE